MVNAQQRLIDAYKRPVPGANQSITLIAFSICTKGPLCNSKLTMRREMNAGYVNPYMHQILLEWLWHHCFLLEHGPAPVNIGSTLLQLKKSARSDAAALRSAQKALV